MLTHDTPNARKNQYLRYLRKATQAFLAFLGRAFAIGEKEECSPSRIAYFAGVEPPELVGRWVREAVRGFGILDTRDSPSRRDFLAAIAQAGVLLPAALAFIDEARWTPDGWIFLVRGAQLSARVGGERAFRVIQLAAAIRWGGALPPAAVGLTREEANLIVELVGFGGIVKIFDRVAGNPALSLENADIGLLLAREANPAKHVVRPGSYLRRQAASSEAIRGYVTDRPQELARLSGLALTNIGVAVAVTDPPGTTNPVLQAAHAHMIDGDPGFRERHGATLVTYYGRGVTRYVVEELRHYDPADGRREAIPVYGAALLVNLHELCRQFPAKLGTPRDQVVALLEEYHRAVGGLEIVRRRFLRRAR
jgi:hypothetical protein